MGTHPLYVRFPDGQICHGCYASASDLARPYLFDSPEAAEAAGYSHDDPYDPALDGFGEPVEVATVYADGFHWRGTAIRDRLTSGGDPFDADGYADGIPLWLAEHFADGIRQLAERERLVVKFCPGCRVECVPAEPCACCCGVSHYPPGFTAVHYEMPGSAVCGHCGRRQRGRGFADGVDLCHTGTLLPDAEPADCYRLVTIYRHATDGSCCRRNVDA